MIAAPSPDARRIAARALLAAIEDRAPGVFSRFGVPGAVASEIIAELIDDDAIDAVLCAVAGVAEVETRADLLEIDI